MGTASLTLCDCSSCFHLSVLAVRLHELPETLAEKKSHFCCSACFDLKFCLMSLEPELPTCHQTFSRFSYLHRTFVSKITCNFLKLWISNADGENKVSSWPPVFTFIYVATFWKRSWLKFKRIWSNPFQVLTTYLVSLSETLHQFNCLNWINTKDQNSGTTSQKQTTCSNSHSLPLVFSTKLLLFPFVFI